MRWLIQPNASALIIPSVVFCQERTNYGMFPATSHNGAQRLIQSWHTRCLSWPFPVTAIKAEKVISESAYFLRKITSCCHQ
jgi:hypothetical protein